MLFPESDTQHLKTSDADGDVLAEFVLALLRRDGDADSVREYFLKEIPDFLSEGEPPIQADWKVKP
ncbi:hypothetical protein F4780DRAFT_784840 [Xylariomycetidae sp. FL0641]|nr:hypothetical protein F4780DRAFT_784840 [Xylariomycetidae sp. FL0641]